ncbi:MAG: efflux RND transporter periplasmic adaptor subunit [Acidobacteriota bacterium]|nr:efflux RND transporter periplasmic adaptor subunit [Acidobacteriota bacterium]
MALLAVGLATCGMACGGSASRPQAAETETPARAAVPTPARTDAVARTTEATQPILSVLTVEHEVDVLAEEGGVVENVLRDEGARVQTGTPLAQLDDRTLRAQLAHDQDDLVVAQDNVKYNQAELKAKQANYVRYQELRKLGLSSDADLEKAKFEAEGAQYDLDSWGAIVKRTESQIRIAELTLAKMQIRAPFDGVVARRYIRQGQLMAKGDRCFRITQLRPLEVRFPVPETSRHTPRAGDLIQVSLASDGSRVFAARILRVGPVVDPASGSWDVLAELVGRLPEDLRPGMAVEVHWPPEPKPTRR